MTGHLGHDLPVPDVIQVVRYVVHHGHTELSELCATRHGALGATSGLLLLLLLLLPILLLFLLLLLLLLLLI